ncbi:hypothetical protein [Sorangium cellulosum]|uniref:Uncharacterized protein n=1 Tax=Sorangium cellulosum TaxID=56 RepID=A0A150QYA0_SORCE|nr:hypothetical protein [Sorangium cellulosum]KYF72980.1 hypothetical protein BE15_04660 [Sorangium cellulosum]
MQPLRSISELPFHGRPALELLNLEQHRDAPDLESTQFGWCQVAEVWLDGRADRAPLRVTDALIVAVHAADEPEALSDDVELEFFVEEVAKDYSVTVLLSTFLDRWLPAAFRGERAIVLAMCNPHAARIRPPKAAGRTPVYYADGDVDTWLDTDGDGRQRIRLEAEAWHIAE